jgi:type VI secretion system secreted protein VgrG
MDTTVLNDDRQYVINNRDIKVDGTHTETVKKDMSTTVSEGNQTNVIEIGSQTNNVQTGKQQNTVKQSIDIESIASEITIKAATKITLIVRASKLTMDAAGNIDLQGSNIQINGSATIRAESPDTDIM